MDYAIYFTNENHLYRDTDGVIYESVSGATKKYIEKFDSEFISFRSAIRDFNEDIYTEAKRKMAWDHPQMESYLRKKIDELKVLPQIKDRQQLFKNKWNKKNLYGTFIHSYSEFEDIKNGYKYLNGIKFKVIPKITGKDFDNSSIALQQAILKEKCNIFIPEAVVHCKKNKIAGQIDGLFLIYLGSGRFYAIIIDYKTDKELSLKSIFSKYKNGFPMMKEDFFFLYDSKLNYYKVKMNFYRMLLKKTYGIDTDRMHILSYPLENNKNKIIPVGLLQKKASLDNSLYNIMANSNKNLENTKIPRNENGNKKLFQNNDLKPDSKNLKLFEL